MHSQKVSNGVGIKVVLVTQRTRKRVRNHERRATEQPAARRARLDRQRTHERRAAEQPAARQARLERLRERNREHRAAEQAETRQPQG